MSRALPRNAPAVVYLTSYVAPRDEARNTVRFELLDGGKALQAEESCRGPRLTYDDLWIFTKKE